MEEINFKAIEEKWQGKWEKESVFVADDKSQKPRYYVLEMFPYPSGSGLHMGHAWNYTIGDILARFKIMNGFNVLHPMGYDSLGLPAENAAIKDGTHPEDYTSAAIKNYIKQQKALGLTYDWSRILKTSSPEYYKWDQWIFLKMFEKGLAYQKESSVNWCPSCKTVLANEQAQNGVCDRCDSKVEIKFLKQWFLKITDYADELYENLDNMEGWPERTRAMQKHWIGKSYGTEIDFDIIKNVKFASYLLIEKSFDINLEEKLKEFGEFKIEEIDKDWGKFFRVKVSLAKEEEFIDFVKKNILVKNEDGGSWYVDSGGTTNKIIFRDKVIDINSEKGQKEFFEYGKKLGLPDEQLDVKLGNEKWSVFTTRPDTIFGVTFVVVAAQHKKLWELVTEEQKPKVEKFLKKLGSVSEKDMASKTPKGVSPSDEAGGKEGVFTGSYAINPANDKKVPIYAGNFVVADYGSGMVMAVPAHDKRDFEFAKKYGIEIREVIEEKPLTKEDELFVTSYNEDGGSVCLRPDLEEAYIGKGTLIFSGDFNYLDNGLAKEKITKWLEKKGVGRKTLNFRLRDWGISRQRYWGTPIPIIHCEKCGSVPIPEKDLPVVLPKDVKFGEGNPLETNEEWINIKCPNCGGEGKREVETMDTFVNSSWYFMRYCDPNNSEKIFDKDKVKLWCPVDSYIGGAEHACMHLIYSRFYTKFFRDIGLIDFGEPAKNLFHQGMLMGEGGIKMSKSKGNVVLPESISNKYGIDTARFFLSSLASPDKDIGWDEKGIIGSLRFVKKIFGFVEEFKEVKDFLEVEIKLNNTIKNITDYYGNFQYRKATIELRELFDLIIENGCSKETLGIALKLLNPICPHITEELWEKIGNKELISISEWPKFDLNKLKVQKKEIDVNSKVIELVKGYLKGKEIKRIYLYVIPFELSKYDVSKLEKEWSKEVVIYSVKDENKYDPQGKSKKARPGLPGVYFE